MNTTQSESPKVKYIHTRNAKREILGTIAIIESEGEFCIGIAAYNRSDRFNRKLGREISLNRALEALKDRNAAFVRYPNGVCQLRNKFSMGAKPSYRAAKKANPTVNDALFRALDYHLFPSSGVSRGVRRYLKSCGYAAPSTSAEKVAGGPVPTQLVNTTASEAV